jgi:outer membrane protein OmpA-like peptidoglycan-associated protein
MAKGMINRQRSRVGSFFIVLAICSLSTSLLIHLFFLQRAKSWEIRSFSPESYDTIVPRTFRMKKVEIDPKTLESETPPIQKPQQNTTPVLLEKEDPFVDQKSLVASANILNKPQATIPIEKPESLSPSQGLDKLLSKAEATTLSSTKGVLPTGNNQETDLGIDKGLNLVDPAETASKNTGDQLGKQQFSSLDDLLAASGTVKKGTAPILMPTDLLFEEDSDTLKPEATESLTKLGSLMKKNANASFQIEGYTDSFGNDEYNMQLSLRRAEAVKNWLFSTMGLYAAHIKTVGYGKSRLLVPATGTVEQQQLNRRVEIVIFTAK